MGRPYGSGCGPGWSGGPKVPSSQGPFDLFERQGDHNDRLTSDRRSHPVKTPLKVLIALLLVALVALPALAATSLTSVVQTPADEWGPAAGSGGIAWNRYTKSSAWVLADTGGVPFRVNPSNTWAWTGSIEGDILTYQRANRRGSDILAFDIATVTSVASPAHVNSKWWEYYPSASGQWVLFARTNVGYGRKHEWRRLILANKVTGETRVLANGGRGASFLPGQVSGDWVVWHNCPKYVCDVYRYQISSATTLKIPKVGPDQHSPAISSDGTMYYVRQGNACGSNATIIRRAPDNSEVVLYSFPDGVEAAELYVYDGPQQDLYLQDVDCGNRYKSDIYKVSSANTAAPVVSQSQADVDGAPSMPRQPMDARPMRAGSTP